MLARLTDGSKNFRRYSETDFPASYVEKAFEIYRVVSLPNQGERSIFTAIFTQANIVTSDRSEFLAIDPKGIVGHLGYDIAVFLNNLHWWRRKSQTSLDS
jgi:streptomycin 6-kinase